MAYSSSISISSTNVQLIRKVFPSTIDTLSYIGYEYRRKVYTPATQNYDAITGPIREKMMIKSLLRSDKRGGDITAAQYTAVVNDAYSSLTF
jgi:hypothetical protein